MELKVDEDILKEISIEEIIKLRDLYKYLPHRRHVHYFLNSTVKWKQHHDGNKYVAVFSPCGNWQTGTFIAVYQCKVYEVFLSTLESNPKILSDIIINTKMIDWSRRMLVYAVHNDHKDTVKEALKATKFHHSCDIHSHIWWMPAEDARKLTIECPLEVSLLPLNSGHVQIINSHWPHKFEGSEEFVDFVLRMNGGWGLFLKDTNELVAWIMRIQMGLGMLYTVGRYRRRGYGHLVTKAMLQEIAEEGIDPVAATLATNTAAQAVFDNIGLRKTYSIVYVESHEEV